MRARLVDGLLLVLLVAIVWAALSARRPAVRSDMPSCQIQDDATVCCHEILERHDDP